MMTFDGKGNQLGPRTKHRCPCCGDPKAETSFKRVHSTGKLTGKCRACRGAQEREAGRKTPIHVKRASTMGKGVEGRWGNDVCPECGEMVCWDIARGGGLVALNRHDRNFHPHQMALYPDTESNRDMVANGENTRSYYEFQTRAKKQPRGGQR